MVRTRQDKIGFSTPEDEWFRGPLRELMSDVLCSASFQARPYFDADRVRYAVRAPLPQGDQHQRLHLALGEPGAVAEALCR